MITVTGAAIVLSWLPASSAGSSFALASAERTNTKRAGQVLAVVGPNLSRSYSWCRVASSTVPENALYVRAWRNSWSSARGSSVASGDGVEGEARSVECRASRGGQRCGTEGRKHGTTCAPRRGDSCRDRAHVGGQRRSRR